jgi:hypothetical protein
MSRVRALHGRSATSRIEAVITATLETTPPRRAMVCRTDQPQAAPQHHRSVNALEADVSPDPGSGRGEDRHDQVALCAVHEAD